MTPATSSSAPRVLVADDDPHDRAWLADYLRAQGYAVHDAHDGVELLDILRMVPPRYFPVVLCDQRMPGLM